MGNVATFHHSRRIHPSTGVGSVVVCNGNPEAMANNKAEAEEKSHKSTAQAGELSWNDWLEENGSKLLLFARQQTRSLADAEDILQDSLVKLALKVQDGSFEGGQGGWMPYIYTALRRSAIDLGRKNDRRTRREDKSVTDTLVEKGEFDDPWFAMGDSGSEMGQQVQAALKEIPPNFAEVIQLKIWGERTFAEIGNILDISQNTAASRYRYGLEGLKKVLSTARIKGDL